MDENNLEVDELLMTYYKGFYDITKTMKNVRMYKINAINMMR